VIHTGLCRISLHRSSLLLLPYTTLFRSWRIALAAPQTQPNHAVIATGQRIFQRALGRAGYIGAAQTVVGEGAVARDVEDPAHFEDRKSTRLNSSHVKISYAVFCIKKKKL